jgi:asparagine synthase (glutamine-hydrolysing)
MCGLSAIVEFRPNGRLLQSLLEMHDRIRHRGPDGEGFTLLDADWQASTARSASGLRERAGADLRAGLAFRWLQIQDPGETAAQPMVSPDGSVWLAFNGEIYNFQELRATLQTLGHRFTSVSDTEVLLAAYLQWGCDCFARLNGMWAIIVLDLRARKLICSRDRFGIKPLFYYRDHDRLLLASEIKQLLAGGAPAAANRAAIARFIRGMRPATPEQTFFQSIFAQPAATYCEIDLSAPPDRLVFQPYWSLEVPERDTLDRAPIEKASEELEELLARSVAEHMVAQAPFAHLISGGLDSSLLAALAAPIYQRQGQRGVGISMVLEPGLRHLDESVYIDQVTKALHFQSGKAELTPAWLKSNVARITWTQEEPIAGMAVAGQFLAYQTAARQGAKVVIDGQGADEFFAGYPRHQLVVLADYARHRAPLALASEAAWLLWRDRGFFRYLWRHRIAGRLARRFGRDRAGTGYDFLSTPPEETGPQKAAPPNKKLSALDQALLVDILSYNLKSVLAVTDRNAMMHSIEARVPYVDRRIGELAFRLPDAYKAGHGQRKRILRLIASRHLPPSVVGRVDRIGFGAPIESWLISEFQEALRMLPESAVFARSSLIDCGKLKGFVEGFLQARHHDAGTIWRLYAVEAWARAFAVGGL